MVQLINQKGLQSESKYFLPETITQQIRKKTLIQYAVILLTRRQKVKLAEKLLNDNNPMKTGSSVIPNFELK